MMMDWLQNPWMWAFGMFGMFLGFIFWLLVLVALGALVRWLWRQGTVPAHHGDSAFEILKRRYASGEINKEEFEAKKRDLLG